LRYWPGKTAEQKQNPATEKSEKRKNNGQWLVHGTWSHGTTADVSPSSAPLSAILFLRQDRKNKIESLTDRKKIWHNLLATLIRPMVTAEWWQKELDVLERIVHEIPATPCTLIKQERL